MDKAPDAFRTISEVADELDVPQHVLRFWETRFTQIKPMKRSGGRRYYRPDDVELLRGIRHLLYGQGYTIRGVQRILREQGIKAVQGRQQVAPRPGAMPTDGGPQQVLPDSDPGAAASDVKAAWSEPAAVEPEAVPTIASLPGRVHLADAPPAVPSLPVAGISPESRKQLAAALDDLVECRRLLDAAFGVA